ncbi:MAG: VWA domain-containing protein [Candidatus Acidiferrales bacterium]
MLIVTRNRSCGHARFVGFSLAALALLCAAAAVSAQQKPTPTPASAGTKIYLDVVVNPKSGPPVTGLAQQDFTILDNKSPQTITSFQAFSGRQAPLQFVVVIDAVNNNVQTTNYARLQIDKFLRAEGGQLAYPFALALLTDQGIQPLTDYSSDGKRLADALDKQNIGLRIVGRSAGFYGAADRLEYSLSAMHQLAAGMAARPGRNIILWVSSGWPLLSGPGVELTSKEEKQIFADIVSFSAQFLAGRITLYAVSPLGAGESVSRGTYYKQFEKGIIKPNQVSAGNLALQVLALQSGGQVFDFNNDVSTLLLDCISDSVPYYELAFDAPPSERPDEYHHLEVKVSKPGLTARTREGYYAQPQSHN